MDRYLILSKKIYKCDSCTVNHKMIAVYTHAGNESNALPTKYGGLQDISEESCCVKKVYDDNNNKYVHKCVKCDPFNNDDLDCIYKNIRSNVIDDMKLESIQKLHSIINNTIENFFHNNSDITIKHRCLHLQECRNCNPGIANKNDRNISNVCETSVYYNRLFKKFEDDVITFISVNITNLYIKMDKDLIDQIKRECLHSFYVVTQKHFVCIFFNYNRTRCDLSASVALYFNEQIQSDINQLYTDIAFYIKKYIKKCVNDVRIDDKYE